MDVNGGEVSPDLGRRVARAELLLVRLATRSPLIFPADGHALVAEIAQEIIDRGGADEVTS